MAAHKRFKFQTKDDLLKMADDLNINLPYSESIDNLFDKVEIAGKTLPNRFVVHPMEGFDSNAFGTPQELSFRRYKRYAAGGSGLIWFEATAVVDQGRSNPGQFLIDNSNADVYKKLVQETRKAGHESMGKDHNPMLVLQITHSGRYSKPTGKPNPIIAHRSPILDPLHNLPEDYKVITDDELDKLQEHFVNAARIAKAAGFDAVDIKACHRYLVAELHASHTRMDSKYGGSFENRTRFILETAKRIKSEVKDIIVTSRLNAYDAISYPYGFGVDKDDYKKEDLTETKLLIKELMEVGYPLLNLSIANPYYNPHFGRPYDFPIVGMDAPEINPLEGVSRLIKIVGDLQKSFPTLPMIGTGYAWLRQYFPNVAAAVVKDGGATLIGQGRGSFAYPDSVKDLMEKGSLDKHKVCVACSCCTQIMRDGGQTGCVVRDTEIYGPKYRESRQNSKDALLKEAERCRDCDAPMCQVGCPAGLDVPGFVKAYQEGDIAKAYMILIEKNPFPEMCSLVCPVEEQCQGLCVENSINAQPISIAKIQKAIAKEARALGIASIKIPETPSGKTIAIVGAGPAGVACAAKLVQIGHSVEIFEKRAYAGGVPGDVIPSERAGFETVAEEVRVIFENAVNAKRLIVHTNAGMNGENTLDALKERFSAVFLGFGMSASVELPNASVRPKGVEDALDFLRRMKSGKDLSIGNKIAILGGGNTAMDAAVTAVNAGAQDVSIIYRRSFKELPAWAVERNHALDIGVNFLILNQPLDYMESAGKLSGLKVIRTELGDADESGRRRPQNIKDSEFVLDVDTVIEAIGQKMDTTTKDSLGALELTKWGTVVVSKKMVSSDAKVFAGGDIINGGATAVQAVADGLIAAESIDELIK